MTRCAHEEYMEMVIDYDDVDNLLKYRAERHIRNFKEQFIVFEKALWGIQYMDTIDIDS